MKSLFPPISGKQTYSSPKRPNPPQSPPPDLRLLPYSSCSPPPASGRTRIADASVQQEDCKAEILPILLSGAWADIGFRASMEDVYICADSFVKDYSGKNPIEGPVASHLADDGIDTDTFMFESPRKLVKASYKLPTTRCVSVSAQAKKKKPAVKLKNTTKKSPAKKKAAATSKPKAAAAKPKVKAPAKAKPAAKAEPAAKAKLAVKAKPVEKAKPAAKAKPATFRS
ncbi:hypothetical protein M8C21_018197 [Ambrosia artemisiifolia]|uniref:Uncharacterized protein n=1 Tax=Ambrosia artemisiifolia TaxID=4212 RepID=A0AAD5D689_AMBAR|nr:hypothetical protein M8C21_018197 [Ambrosia artemisiifolia]